MIFIPHRYGEKGKERMQSVGYKSFQFPEKLNRFSDVKALYARAHDESNAEASFFRM